MDKRKRAPDSHPVLLMVQDLLALLQWQVSGLDATTDTNRGRTRSARGKHHHRVFVRAEVAYTGVVEASRHCANRVLSDKSRTCTGCSSQGEVVAALCIRAAGGIRQHAVNQAGIGLGWTTGRADRSRSARTKLAQGVRVSECRISGLVCNLRRVDGAN